MFVFKGTSVFSEIPMLFFRFLFTCNVGLALTGIGVALLEVGVTRATPKVYKPPPLPGAERLHRLKP